MKKSFDFLELKSNKKFCSGFPTLLHKELLRFWKVSFQTVAAPVLTALLYLVVFSQISPERIIFQKISYIAFLSPGLIMMSILQNSFANSSSSLIQSKITGNLVFMLLPPLSYQEIFTAYLLASSIRGLIVGFFVWLISIIFIDLPFHHPFLIILFAIISSAIMGIIGIVAGLWAEKFDQLSLFQNFIIMPATFLSGVFYSFQSLSPFWQKILLWNPIFYAIDGFRYAFFSESDISPWNSLFVVVGTFFILSIFTLRLLSYGYKLKG
ncbi:MAG: ABC transporter permease [Bordetella sp.]|nr:MAG: ABC transporter permease [Bordetella sp.]